MREMLRLPLFDFEDMCLLRKGPCPCLSQKNLSFELALNFGLPTGAMALLVHLKKVC